MVYLWNNAHNIIRPINGCNYGMVNRSRSPMGRHSLPIQSSKATCRGHLGSGKTALNRTAGSKLLSESRIACDSVGINVDDFHFSDNERIKARAKIFADDRAFVVLFLGRLSFHCKAHPLTMYRARVCGHCNWPGD